MPSHTVSVSRAENDGFGQPGAYFDRLISALILLFAQSPGHWGGAGFSVEHAVAPGGSNTDQILTWVSRLRPWTSRPSSFRQMSRQHKYRCTVSETFIAGMWDDREKSCVSLFAVSDLEILPLDPPSWGIVETTMEGGSCFDEHVP